MPIIHMHLVAGRDDSLVQECAREVARTVHRTLGAPLDTIRVLVHQTAPTHWIAGDKTRAEVLAAQRTDAAPQAGEGDRNER